VEEHKTAVNTTCMHFVSFLKILYLVSWWSARSATCTCGLSLHNKLI